MKTAHFNAFALDMELDDALAASHQGECDADVAQIIRLPYIAKQLDAIGPDTIRKELREYGAWDADELADDEANRERIAWIAAGNIREDERP